MHEAGIAAEVIRMAVEEAVRRASPRVVRVGVRVGSMSGVVVEALTFAFDALKAETPGMACAELDVEFIAVRARCALCGTECIPEDDLVLWCPQCGTGLDILQGRELDLAWIELDDKEGQPCNELP